MGDWDENITFSIIGCKSAKMTITLAGMLLEDQKNSVANDI